LGGKLGRPLVDWVTIRLLRAGKGDVAAAQTLEAPCRSEKDHAKRPRLATWDRELDGGLRFRGCRYDGGGPNGFSLVAIFQADSEALELELEDSEAGPKLEGQVERVLLGVAWRGRPVLGRELLGDVLWGANRKSGH